MSKTSTSSFGVARRESHDASEFYTRSLYRGELPMPRGPVDADVEIPPLDGWADRIYPASAAAMHHVPDNGVALAFTSPPYNVGKEYDGDMSLDAYLQLIR